MQTTKLNLHDKLPLTCTRTGTCCHGKNVNLNPWELVCLAKSKEISPRSFRDLYGEFGGIRLRFNGNPGWKSLSACSQYKEGLGCSVHLGRPLACRLYPLGRQKQNEEISYIYQGSAFPCLEGCPDVTNLPQLSVEAYLKDQAAEVFETTQDEYLEVMQNLADIAFVLLLETDLAQKCEQTLKRWYEMGNEDPEILALYIGSEWIDRLMLPELSNEINNPIDFAKQHNELLQMEAQHLFEKLRTIQDLHEAACLFMGLALHLSRGLGANPSELAEHWISTAKTHGAK